MSLTKRILTDAKAVIDLGVRRYYWMTDEQYERALKEAASEIVDFLRDHRSRDHYSIDIETIYKEICRFCHSDWECDPKTGEPYCCTRAQEYWEAEQYCKVRP